MVKVRIGSLSIRIGMHLVVRNRVASNSLGLGLVLALSLLGLASTLALRLGLALSIRIGIHLGVAGLVWLPAQLCVSLRGCAQSQALAPIELSLSRLKPQTGTKSIVSQ